MQAGRRIEYNNGVQIYCPVLGLAELTHELVTINALEDTTKLLCYGGWR